MEAKALALVAAGVFVVEVGVCPCVAGSVLLGAAASGVGAPTIVAVEEEDEMSLWEARSVDGTPSASSGVPVGCMESTERERLQFIGLSRVVSCGSFKT